MQQNVRPNVNGKSHIHYKKKRACGAFLFYISYYFSLFLHRVALSLICTRSRLSAFSLVSTEVINLSLWFLFNFAWRRRQRQHRRKRPPTRNQCPFQHSHLQVFLAPSHRDKERERERLRRFSSLFRSSIDFSVQCTYNLSPILLFLIFTVLRRWLDFPWVCVSAECVQIIKRQPQFVY